MQAFSKESDVAAKANFEISWNISLAYNPTGERVCEERCPRYLGILGFEQALTAS